MKKIITVVIALTAACAAATIANAQTVTTPAEAATLAAAVDTVKAAVADTVMVAAPAGVEVFQATGEKAPAKNTAKADKPANGQDKAAKADAQQKADKKAVKEGSVKPEEAPAELSEEDLAAQPAKAMTAEELEAKKAEVAAQIAELEEMECESEFEKSTSLAVGLGAQYYMGENDKYWEDAGLDIVTTNVIDLSFARQKTPVFSWGANLNAAEFIGLYKQTNPNSKFTTDEYIWKHTQGAMYYYRQSGWYARADLFASFNLINICRGYKEKPIFDLDWYIGAGGIVGFGSEDETSSLAPQLTTGLNAKFNITKGFAIKASIRGAAVGDKFDGESRADEPDEVHKKANVPVDGILGATVGVCFRLGRNK